MQGVLNVAGALVEKLGHQGQTCFEFAFVYWFGFVGPLVGASVAGEFLIGAGSFAQAKTVVWAIGIAHRHLGWSRATASITPAAALS